jgi:hypothetical protein
MKPTSKTPIPLRLTALIYIYRTDRNSTHSSGGVAILIRKNIKHYQSTLPKMTNIEGYTTAVIVSTERHEIKI